MFFLGPAPAKEKLIPDLRTEVDPVEDLLSGIRIQAALTGEHPPNAVATCSFIEVVCAYPERIGQPAHPIAVPVQPMLIGGLM